MQNSHLIKESRINYTPAVINTKFSKPPEDKRLFKAFSENKKLVSLLKTKIFKGYKKVNMNLNEKLNLIIDKKTKNLSNQDLSRSIQENKSFLSIKLNKQNIHENKEKTSNAIIIEDYNKHSYKIPNLQDQKINIVDEKNISNLFLTQKDQEIFPRNKILEKDTKKYLDDISKVNVIKFCAFDVKLPEFKQHFNNKIVKFEKDIMKEINQINKQNLDNYLPGLENTENYLNCNTEIFEISKRNKSACNPSSYGRPLSRQNFKTNPGLIRGFLKNFKNNRYLTEFFEYKNEIDKSEKFKVFTGELNNQADYIDTYYIGRNNNFSGKFSDEFEKKELLSRNNYIQENIINYDTYPDNLEGSNKNQSLIVNMDEEFYVNSQEEKTKKENFTQVDEEVDLINEGNIFNEKNNFEDISEEKKSVKEGWEFSVENFGEKRINKKILNKIEEKQKKNKKKNFENFLSKKKDDYYKPLNDKIEKNNFIKVQKNKFNKLKNFIFGGADKNTDFVENIDKKNIKRSYTHSVIVGKNKTTDKIKIKKEEIKPILKITADNLLYYS